MSFCERNREGFTTGMYLEDVFGLEEMEEEEEEYLEELRRLREYIQSRMREEAVSDATMEGLERLFLGALAVSSKDTDNWLERRLQKCKREREETELSGIDGTESVTEREA